MKYHQGKIAKALLSLFQPDRPSRFEHRGMFLQCFRHFARIVRAHRLLDIFGGGIEIASCCISSGQGVDRAGLFPLRDCACFLRVIDRALRISERSVWACGTKPSARI